MIVFTSDHGDYLGDHWLGEKELFHEESVRIPLIIVDPDARAERGRGGVRDELVEAIDLIPTFVEATGESDFGHRLEGRSLLSLSRRGDAPTAWRDAVFSETDYAHREAREHLNLPVDSARAYMVRSSRWKFVFYEDFPAQLFDMQEDASEQNDLGASSAHAQIVADHREMLFAWSRHRRTRTTLASGALVNRHRKVRERGILIGVW